MAELTPEQKQRYLYILYLMSQGRAGRAKLQAFQPYLAMIEQNEAEDKAKKARDDQNKQALYAQGGQLAGTLGGTYLMGQMMGQGAAAGAGGAAGAGAGAATGAGTAGGAAAGGTAAGGTAAGGTAAGGAGSGLAGAASTAGIAALVAAGLNNLWESGGKDILRGRGDKQDWANFGWNVAGLGLPNVALRLMGKPSLGRYTTSGKSDAQLLRDDFRGELKSQGIADNDYNVTLADGTKFNIGKDGKATLLNSDGKTERRYWNVDTNNPLANYAITKIDPLVRAKYNEEAVKAGYNPEQFTAIMVNAATSNAKSEADVDRNLASIFGTSEMGKGLVLPNSSSAPAPQNNPTAPQPSTPAPAPAAGQPEIFKELQKGASQSTPQNKQMSEALGSLFSGYGAQSSPSGTGDMANYMYNFTPEKRDEFMRQIGSMKGLFALPNQQR